MPNGQKHGHSNHGSMNNYGFDDNRVCQVKGWSGWLMHATMTKSLMVVWDQVAKPKWLDSHTHLKSPFQY